MTTSDVVGAVVLMAGMVGGCVGGDGAGTGPGRVLLSDGTAAGDLIEAQMRTTDLVCGCIGDTAGIQACFDIVWPGGKATCLRDSVHAHELDNLSAVSCYTVAYEELNACLRISGCSEESDNACNDQFIADEDACPKLTDDAASDMRLCFPEIDNWPSEE